MQGHLPSLDPDLALVLLRRWGLCWGEGTGGEDLHSSGSWRRNLSSTPLITGQKQESRGVGAQRCKARGPGLWVWG